MPRDDENTAKKPCPKCHRLLTAQSVFDFEAFLPTDIELNHALSHLKVTLGSDYESEEEDKKPQHSFKKIKSDPSNAQASTSNSVIILSDSDDDLPPVSAVIAKMQRIKSEEVKIKPEEVKPKVKSEDLKPRMKLEELVKTPNVKFEDLKPDIKIQFGKAEKVSASTKMKYLLQQIQEFELTDPTIKTVVLCSFVRGESILHFELVEKN